MSELFHHTDRPFIVSKKFDIEEKFKKFLNLYEINLNEIDKFITSNVKGDGIIGVEVTEGMKKIAPKLINFLEERFNIHAILSIDACFGSCDIKGGDYVLNNIKNIIHFGNVKMDSVKQLDGLNILYIPLFIKIKPDKMITKAIQFLKEKKYKNVGLLSSIQYINNVNYVEKKLVENNINVYIGKGTSRVKYPSQVLGCNISSAQKVKNKVDVFLFFEDGNFHALPVSIATKKDVHCFDIVNEKMISFKYKDIVSELSQKKKKIIFREFNNAAVIVSKKVGQNRLQLALKIKEKLTKLKIKTIILYCDSLDIDYVNRSEYDFFVSTLCPRVALDERNLFNKPIYNSIEIIQIINEKEDDTIYFDQIS